MTPYLRLRQICLSTDDLPRAIADISAIFGVCLAHEDPNVAVYGVRNALFPFGLSFVEVVAPMEDADNAAARFVRRGAGRGAYMAIFNCDDPLARRPALLALGLRIAAEIAVPGFQALQLHPRDCRATMIEFDHSPGEEDLRGPYHPAGGTAWTAAVRTEVTQGLREVVIESPTPAALAEHWARILDSPLRAEAGQWTIEVEMCRLRFEAGPAEALTTLVVEVLDPAAMLARAAERGYAVSGQRVRGLCGVDFALQPGQATDRAAAAVGAMR
jgi:hypothetical protein